VNAEVITIGSELLHGIVRDTNFEMIARMLGEIGVEVAFHTTVGDDSERMGEVFRAAVHRGGAVIATGGLGPTSDDVTRKVIATVFRRRLVLDETVLDRIRARFRARGMEMPPINEGQALVPRGAKVIENERGSAPGLHFAHQQVELFFLPGVPSEAEGMLTQYVIPFLRQKAEGLQIGRRTVRTIGISESLLAERLQALEGEEPAVTFGYLAHPSGVDLHVSAASRDPNWLRGELDRVERKLIEAVGVHAYGTGRQTLSDVVGQALAGRGLRLATAESFTGGAIGVALTATPGSSRYYAGGVVAYSNEAKKELLGVGSDSLRRYGAVSAEVALEMARGARERFGADIAIASTGIAGPDGASEEKPVGLALLALAASDEEAGERHLFGGGRTEIVSRATAVALDLLRRHLGAGIAWSEPSSRS
jgi:nicotinamide-nucleotide amidase